MLSHVDYYPQSWGLHNIIRVDYFLCGTISANLFFTSFPFSFFCFNLYTMGIDRRFSRRSGFDLTGVFGVLEMERVQGNTPDGLWAWEMVFRRTLTGHDVSTCFTIVIITARTLFSFFLFPFHSVLLFYY